MSISGKYMTAEIGVIGIEDNYAWDADEDVKELDRTVGADNGYRNRDGGVQGLKVTIKGYMDVTNGQYAEVEAGTIITNLKLYRDVNDATPAYLLPECIVLTSKQGGEVDGKIEWTASIANKGTYTYSDPV